MMEKQWLFLIVLASLMLGTQQATVASATIVQVEVKSQVSSATGIRESVVSINDVFRITVTGATAMRVDGGQTELTRSTYSSEVLRIVTQFRTNFFSSITQFAAIQIMGTNREPRLTVYTSSDNVTLYGACQVHVNEKEGFSMFIEDTQQVTGINVADVINRQVFLQEFKITITGGAVVVTNRYDTNLITITLTSRRYDLPLARRVTYSPASLNLTFQNMDNTTVTFLNIALFSIFFRNKLEVFNSSGNASEIIISLSNGGTLYVNDVEGTALFTSNSNPTVALQLDGATLAISGTYTYDIETDSFGAYFLVVTRHNGTSSRTREAIVVLTGALVIEVGAFQGVSYSSDEVVILGSDGQILTRLSPIGHLVINSNAVPFVSYTSLSSVLFSGPGTLVINRGSGFFTTDVTLGQSLSFSVSTAPIPLVRFERVHLRFNVINGITYSVGAVVQRIGGDIVSVYEAVGYDTHGNEVIIYADSEVTVHQSITVGSGGLSYTGSQQTLTYTTSEGHISVLRNIETLYVFNGGQIEVSTDTDNASVVTTGRLFVSENGTEVIFSTSEIISAGVTSLIRRLVVAQLSLSVNQFSSATSGVYRLSTKSAHRVYIGGGTIWYSVFNGTAYSFYVDDVSLGIKIIQAVSTFLGLTKSVPPRDLGSIDIIFNGQVIYSYLAVHGNADILITTTAALRFNGTTLYGDVLPSGPYGGISEVVMFSGMQVRVFDYESGEVVFVGPGLLLVQWQAGSAFFTTWPATVNYILQAIATLRQYLFPPVIDQSGTDNLKVSGRSAVVSFGTNVRAFEGANISFVCSVAAGIPPPEIVIFRADSSGLTPLVETNNTARSTLALSGISVDDSGEYLCRADNGVPPVDEVTSRLIVREAAAPQLRPGWIPFVVGRGELIVWPSDLPVTRSFSVHTVKVLHLSCRVDGRPWGEVMWQFNGAAIGSALGPTTNVTEVRPGRSVLSIDVEMNRDILSGSNSVECSAGNSGGVTSGRVIIQGVVYACDELGDEPCSRTCGIGIKEMAFACRRSLGGMAPQPVPLSEVPEEVVPLAQRSRPCIPVDSSFRPIVCPITEYRWRASEWSECSQSCSTGARLRNVTCLEVSVPVDSLYQPQLGNTTETLAEDGMCAMSNTGGEKPTDRELCNPQPCPIWHTSQYSECSATCGRGVKMRTVTCNMIIGRFKDTDGEIQLNMTVVNEALCNEEDRQADTRPCSRGRCPFEWRLGQFRECGNVALPEEFRFCRQRQVFCYNANPNPIVGSRRVPEALCADQKQPISLASCGGGRCFNGIWSPLPWTKCSEECGYGTRGREVLCYSPLKLIVVPREFCDSSTTPAASSPCFLRNCENTCLRDEHLMVCPILARRGLCGSPFAMANNGTRCCASCMGMTGAD